MVFNNKGVKYWLFCYSIWSIAILLI